MTIEFISIFIIVWGVVLALFRMASLVGRRPHNDLYLSSRWLRIRRTMGEVMLMGLQFLVAADIIMTICNPDVKTISVLAGIVIIRVVLSFSLGKEIEGLGEREEKTPDLELHPEEHPAAR